MKNTFQFISCGLKPARRLILGAIIFIAGCHSAHVSQPLTQTLGGNDMDSQLEFWHQLEARPLASNDEAFHGLLLYLDQTDPNTNYADRVRALKSRHLLPADFTGTADDAVTRGTLAVAISRALGIKGGMMMHLTGGNERYAVRELVYDDLYPPSTPNQTFSGADFVGIIGRMEDYQTGNPADVPATVMPKESPAAK